MTWKITVGQLVAAIKQAGAEQGPAGMFHFDHEVPAAAVLDMQINLGRVADILNDFYSRRVRPAQHL